MDNSITIYGVVFTLLCKSVADNLIYEINKKTRYDEWDTHRDVRLNVIRNVRYYVKFT